MYFEVFIRFLEDWHNCLQFGKNWVMKKVRGDLPNDYILGF